MSGRSIGGLLLDIDGVLTVSWVPIPGAVGAISLLRRRDVPFALITNTTTVTRAGIADRLQRVGFDVGARDILTAPLATAGYVKRHHPGATCYLLGIDDIVEDLEGVRLVDQDADVVIVGGADEAFTFDNINRAFRMLMDGAALVAMHRNLYWMEADGLSLDAGAYVLGFEAASGVKAEVAGKPSADFFRSGLEMLGMPAERVAMVGDDVENDVLAAQALRMMGVLVRTGKFRADAPVRTDERPDHVVDSVADVPELLEREG